jgi:hypothetical protein
LEGEGLSLVPEIADGEAVQLVVHEGQQRREGLRIAPIERFQQTRNLAGRRLRHRLTASRVMRVRDQPIAGQTLASSYY